jgi:hypothetical protein
MNSKIINLSANIIKLVEKIITAILGSTTRTRIILKEFSINKIKLQDSLHFILQIIFSK